MEWLPPDHRERVRRVRVALDGLSVGDAFGEQFFGAPFEVQRAIADRALPEPPWPYTDDTEMALAISTVLDRCGRVDQDALAVEFARRYLRAPGRGYGGTAHAILRAIGAGEPWRRISAAVFEGAGSMGNGAAMRVAVVGAYFADDLDRVVVEARRSAEVTHSHPEGQAGAIAVALACASASSVRSPEALFGAVLERTPEGRTRDGIERASALALHEPPERAAEILGSGRRVISEDTVPFTLWCGAKHLAGSSYAEALWTTVAGLGDRDTTCAIVGGLIALSGAVPARAWLEAREPFDTIDAAIGAGLARERGLG